MCGIAGVFHIDGAPASAAAIRRMIEAIAHRGPDGEGVWVEGPVGLGHRRLAIIDLSEAGQQPMATADGRFVVSYNGEIYNFQELRVELQALGHRFRTRTDTEVMLAALAEWGLAALPRFNGMFAFALYDRAERKLTLARDRFGIKPLYWMADGSRILFGSEAKAILAAPGTAAVLDREALVEYLTFQNFFTDRTLFRGIHLLPPATVLILAPGRPFQTVTWWDFDFREAEADNESALADECDRLFRQAVGRQLVADVPIGAYLSGGIDSGAITAVAAEQIPGLRSFTVGFDLTSASGLELGFDERAKAEYMSYLFGTEHYQMVLKAGDMERVMSELAWHLEEPRVGQSYPNYYAAKLASRFGKVVLAGTGGDEIFGGYPWRYYRAVVNDSFADYLRKYYSFWQRLLTEEELPRVLAPIWPEVRHVEPRQIFAGVFRRHADALARPEDYVNHSLYFEAKTFLHGLLVVEDKLSMAHGLETRVPFLDNDLVEFGIRLPVRCKLGNLDDVIRIDENMPGNKRAAFFERTRDGKKLLRAVLQRYVPEQVSRAVKQGFSAPDASWFRGDSIAYVQRVLYDRRAAIYDVLDHQAVLGLVDEHLAGQRNRRLLVWSLLYLEAFLQTFLKASEAKRTA